MATTDIDIASRALVLIGANPITSFTDGSREAVVASNLYEEISRGEMSSYPWRFLTTQERMNREVEAPVGEEWDASYTIPISSLRLLNVKVNGRPIRFDTFLKSVYTNTSTNDIVVAEYVKDVSEDDWPHFFRNYIVFRMASLFASSLGRDGNLTTAMAEQAEILKRMARTSDSQGRTTKRLPLSRLVKVRYGGHGVIGETPSNG